MRNLYVTVFLGLLFGGAAVGQSFNFVVLEVDADTANIPVNEVISGGPPPQGIPALGFTGSFNGRVPPTPAPKFIAAEAASAWLEPQEPVLAFGMNGEAKAYPLQILMWHEIANDVVGGVPVAVTFCPLCNSAFAYDRRVPLTQAQLEAVRAKNPNAPLVEPDAAYLEAYADEVGEEAAAQVVAALEVTFGTSGMLFNSNLVMFDSATSTLWAQLAAEGNVGTLTGVKLLRYPVQIVSFAEFREAFPEGVVLSRETGFSRRYGQNPYVGYDRVDQPPFLFSGPTDGRLPPKLRVVSLELGGEPVAYPFSVLEEVRVVNDAVGGVPIVVMWREGTTSALDRSSISGSKDVGAVAVFRRELDGRVLTFEWNGEAFVDQQTGSTWNLFGAATSGPLEGQRLEPVIHDNTLWFAWAAFKPETRVYGISTE
ncbi:DUF3179 domain-containing protein [Marinithermus hydrothermalis]|uniref:DUF3179 domain-containing protein n=1 Tax=Marinithermus hydrothermalis (strain DSM 14884 / JCM 11576 / T1) TaxID=869210 RepID=F2NLB8_MARHT|nr:DUF3179 domain-containing protein [Marinithermus hydrothermalis]AEB11737.1 hypothetical protein Marky_0994 [Marinithermus hydrothermalis DSM 14884]